MGSPPGIDGEGPGPQDTGSPPGIAGEDGYGDQEIGSPPGIEYCGRGVDGAALRAANLSAPLVGSPRTSKCFTQLANVMKAESTFMLALPRSYSFVLGSL